MATIVYNLWNSMDREELISEADKKNLLVMKVSDMKDWLNGMDSLEELKKYLQNL